MINLAIIEDDIIQSKQMINIISSKLDNVRLYNLSIMGKEALDIINSQDIDIILLDLNLPDISGIDILEYISKNNMKKYTNSIIIVSGDNALRSMLPISSYIHTIISKPVSYDDLVYRISNIAVEKNIIKNENIIKNKINKELELLNFNFSYNGTRYLAETILELYNHRNNYIDNLKHDIFPILARRHNKTVNTIVGNIKQSINSMFFDCDEKIIISYFNYNHIMKPKLKEICFTVLNKLDSI